MSALRTFRRTLAWRKRQEELRVARDVAQRLDPETARRETWFDPDKDVKFYDPDTREWYSLPIE